MMRFKCFSILLGCCFCMGALQAQPPNWTYSIFNKSAGLPQDFVYSALEDKKGLIWAGTSEGLARYDSKEINVFTVADSLSSDFVTSSFISSSGAIFFGHFQGSVTLYNGVFFQEIIEDTLSSELVSIAEDNYKMVWCATRSAGLVRWNEQQAKKQFFFPDQLRGKIINKIAITNDILLVATNEGLEIFQLSREGVTFKRSLNALLFKDVTTLTPMKNEPNKYWVGTADAGIYILNLGKAVPVINPLPFDMADLNIRAIIQDSPSSIWVGTFQKGVLNLQFNKNYTSPKVTYFNESTGFPILGVSALYASKSGNQARQVMWVCTLNNGLVMLSNLLFKYCLPAPTYPDIQEINDIAQGDAPGFYLATNAGLFRFSPGQQTDSTTGFSPLNVLKGAGLMSLCFTNHQLWVGKKTGGVQVFKEDNGELKEIVSYQKNLKLIDKVRFFSPDHMGNIWLSVVGKGVLKVNKWGKILEQHSTRSGFIHNEIFAICPGSNGEVWFGSLGSGLAKMDIHGNIERFSQQGAFPSHDVQGITEDDEGNIWIATDGQGYFKYDGETFERMGGKFSSDDFLYIEKISYNGQGKIWVTREKSISYFDLTRKKSRHFQKIGGNLIFRTKSYSSAVFFGKQQDALFVDRNSLIYFNLGDIPPPIKLSTHLVELQVSFKPYRSQAPSKVDVLKGIYPTTSLRYMENHITFNLIAWDPTYTGKVYYRHYLENLENTWSAPTQQHIITYPSIPPGEHTLHVQASYQLHAWDDNPKTTYSFAIDTPYWDTWWFYMLQVVILLILFGTTYSISRNRSAMRFKHRVMVFASVFIVFEYVQVWLESATVDMFGGVPVYEIIFKFCLALMLLPLERWVSRLLKAHKHN